MTEENPRYNDEIDLVELFLTMWLGKWIIIGSIAISLLAAGLYLAFAEPKYESRISIKQNIIPPFLETTNIATAPAIEDFIDKFYSQEIFSAWAKKSTDKHLTSTRRYSQFDEIKNKKTELVVNSVDPKIIDAHFQYVGFINRLLTQEYQTSSKEELIFLKDQAEDIGSYSDQIVNLLLNTNRFLKNAGKGELVIDTEKPTEPVKISPKMELVLTLFVVLGGFLGCASVLLMNVLKKRKLDAAKSASRDS